MQTILPISMSIGAHICDSNIINAPNRKLKRFDHINGFFFFNNDKIVTIVNNCQIIYQEKFQFEHFKLVNMGTGLILVNYDSISRGRFQNFVLVSLTQDKGYRMPKEKSKDGQFAVPFVFKDKLIMSYDQKDGVITYIQDRVLNNIAKLVDSTCKCACGPLLITRKDKKKCYEYWYSGYKQKYGSNLLFQGWMGNTAVEFNPVKKHVSLRTFQVEQTESDIETEDESTQEIDTVSKPYVLKRQNAKIWPRKRHKTC